MPPPEDLAFRIGIAYPIRAQVGEWKLGAKRVCVFNTGTAFETITVFEPAKRLRFHIDSQPAQMEELCPYVDVHAPHLHGFVESEDGEFRLTRLPNGYTRLEGLSWYRNNIAPGKHGALFTDRFVHQIHARVFAQIKRLATSRGRAPTMRKPTLLTVGLICLSACARADVAGQRIDYRSPNGVTESCVMLSQIPGGAYSAKDVETEKRFCAIDLYGPRTALCPKTWSTSPGTMVYDTEGLSPANYEASRCSGKNGHVKLAKFKNTMNAEATSSTFSISSLLYYHFSRYFDTSTDISPVVYRSIDKDDHYRRVSSRAQGMGSMNRAGWELMRSAERNPAAYGSAIDELFTSDRQQIFGVLMKDKGVGYGPEIDGTEASGWGAGSNNDFQQTPAFMALRSTKPLAQAIPEGLALAIQDPAIQRAMGPSTHPVQMAYWMKELTEITLMDYIFSQQDRIQNIDYVWEWTYIDQGAVKSIKVTDDKYEKLSRLSMGKIPVPPQIAAFKPILLQRSILGDNDAGGRVQYTNFTKKTQMLEKIRHYNAGLYRKLIALNRDFAARGALYRYAAETFGLSQKQLDQLVNNTALATGILKATCHAGQLRFDLQPKQFFLGQATEQPVDCENP